MWLLWRGEVGVDVASLGGEVRVDVASLERGGRDRCGFSGEWRVT